MIDLHQGEEIKLMIRKHWFVFLGKIFFIAILLFFPFLIMALFGLVESYIGTIEVAVDGFLVGALIAFFTVLWVFFIWMWVFAVWTDYYLDTWIVTNRRIISIEQKGFFRREISTFRMERVQDITTKVGGLIPTFLNYGNITVQTAGEQRSFVMRGAPAPANVKEAISVVLESNRNNSNYQGGGL